jgi:hypothetical protein
MKLSVSHSSAQIDIKIPDKLINFFLYLAANRDDPRIYSILDLIQLYDKENDKDEKLNIINTLVELIENKPIL